ncbi:helix-turn-helix domain-containing protein [Actinoplanes sp. CA-142083]|uniref:helix-turn-helix domain-containing protein n=1 Tax=Actinoplanes sp. CA-142083 TaxID=3239903 RepID=UPI003D8E0600
MQQPEVATVLAFRTAADGRSDLIVVGPRTRGTYNPGKPLAACARVRLRPGQVRPVLGVPASALVDRAFPLTELWGDAALALTDHVAAAGSDAAALLQENMPKNLGISGVDVAADLLKRPGARLSEVAADVGVSERYLRTLFAREVGLSPKHFARISRVRTVLSLAGRRPWAEVAAKAGFFDQAHMIGDFRSMMGVSPGAFLAGRLPAVTPCSLTPRL